MIHAFFLHNAWILLELGDQAGATPIFSQAFKGYADFFPDVLTFLEEADEVYEQEGELWAKAIQSGCGDSMTWCALGSYYKDCVQDLNRAEAAYKVSLVLDRNNVITLHNLGLLIMEAGWQERLLEAAGYFEKSYSLSQGRFKFAREQLTELQAMPEYQRQRRHQRNR